MKILHSRLVKQNIYIVIAVLLSLFTFAFIITHHYYLIICIMLFLIAIIRKPYHLLFCLLFLLILFLIYLNTKSDVVDEKLKGNYRVIKKTAFGFLIKHNGNRIFVFSRVNITIEDEVFVSGKSYIYQGKMENYFRSLNVKSVISNAFVRRIKISKNVFNIIHHQLITGNQPYDKLVSLLFLGEKNWLNNAFYKLGSEMNISYLFVISGFHIWILYFVISKSLFFIKKINQDIISCFLIFIYILIIKIPISAFRAWMMLCILIITRHLKQIKLSKMEIMAISLVILVLIYPYSIFGFSLPLTFISTFVILNIASLQISNLKKALMIPFIMFIVMMPFNVIFNNKISLIAPFYSLLITPVFTFFYLLLFITLPFWDFANFLCAQFIFFIEKMSIINFTINVDKTWLWFFFTPYLFSLISFIIYDIWHLYLAKKNI